jgi:hypothetical protein
MSRRRWRNRRRRRWRRRNKGKGKTMSLYVKLTPQQTVEAQSCFL